MAGAILLFDFSSFCQFNAKTSTLGAGREIYHRRTIHSTIESWSCIKRTLVHIAKSNREQQQQSSFEETNPFPVAAAGGCGGKQRTGDVSSRAQIADSFAYSTIQPYIKGVQLHAEITNRGGREFKHPPASSRANKTHSLLVYSLGRAQPSVR